MKKDEFKIMEMMNDIKYGWLCKNGEVGNDDNFFKEYHLASPEEVLQNKVGNCWDQVELERFLFEENGFKVKTYFIVYEGDNYPTHTFLVFSKKGKFYWFEHSWEWHRGIHEYSSLDELIIDVRNKFIEELEDYKIEDLKVFEYLKPKSHLTVRAFCKYCMSGELIR